MTSSSRDHAPAAGSALETAHTPGPWHTKAAFLVRTKYGTPVAEARLPMGRSGAECAANARLIAAAPDLLERLRAIIDWADFALSNPAEFDSHGVRNLDGPIFDEARAVLAKATGTESCADLDAVQRQRRDEP